MDLRVQSVVLFLLLPSVYSTVFGSTSIGIDVCHSEPLVEVIKSPSSNASSCAGDESILIQMKLHPNPNHSLYDTGWATVHYLRNCLSPPYWRSKWSMKQLFLNMEVPYSAKLSLCAIEPDEDTYDRWKRPLWGPCMLRAVALDMGVPDENIFAGPPFNTTRCFPNTVTFRETFRPLAYRATLLQSDQNETNVEQQVPDWVKRDVLNCMAEAPFRSYLSHDREWSKTWLRIQQPRRKLNVLVYDRMDRRPHKLKRKWHSAQTLVAKLRTIERLVVDHRSELPKALPSQAKLFRWADVVVAPHGAAMANTLFMQPGSQVVEITKCCRREVRLKPEAKRDWTGWHSDYIGLNLRYLQCHPMNGTLSVKELAAAVERDPTRADPLCSMPFFRVDDSEAFATVQGVLPGQMRRVARGDLKKIPRRYWSNYHVVSTMCLLTVLIVALLWRTTHKRRELGNKGQINDAGSIGGLSRHRDAEARYFA